MAVDLSNKKIIMIHGLASKPPPDLTHHLWRKTLTENIRVSHRRLARNLDDHADVFESAYWANVIPHHIPDDTGYCRKLGLQVDKVINERREIRDSFHVGMKEKVGVQKKASGCGGVGEVGLSWNSRPHRAATPEMQRIQILSIWQP